MATKPPNHRGLGYKPREVVKRLADKARPSSAERGYGSKWRRESAAFLLRPENRLCACGCGREANMVDHKRAHKGDASLFWSRSNWQPMHRSCNSKKAAAIEGGFGNPIVGR